MHQFNDQSLNFDSRINVGMSSVLIPLRYYMGMFLFVKYYGLKCRVIYICHCFKSRRKMAASLFLFLDRQRLITEKSQGGCFLCQYYTQCPCMRIK